MIDILAMRRSLTPMGNRKYGGGGSSGGSTTYTQNMPKELMPYALGQAEGAWREAQRGYTPYEGQRVAGPSGMQEQAWWQAQNQRAPGQIGEASNIASGAAYGPSGFGQQGMGLMGQAAGMTGQAGQRFTGGENYAMGSLLNQGQITPEGRAGMGGIQSGMQGSTTGSFLDPGVAGRYMDPYQQNVTDIAKRQAVGEAAQIAQNQRAQTGMRGGIGGIGGYRDQLLQAEGNKNLATNLSDIQTRGSEAAYQNAQALYGTEADRALRAAQQRGTLGATLAQEARGGQDLGLRGYQAYLQGAQGIGGQELQRAQQMGALGGQMSDQARQQQALSLDAARALGTFGGQQYDMERGLTSDLAKYGEQQRAMQQQDLDTRYQDFLRQEGWNRDMLNWMGQQLHGGNISSSSTTTGGQGNPWSQAAGAGLSTAALMSMASK